MEGDNKFKQKDNSFERDVFEAIQNYNFNTNSHIHITEEEINLYVRMFGNTEIELPDNLVDPGDVFDSITKGKDISKKDMWAIAARRQNPDILPDDVIKKIKKDISEKKWLENKNNETK